MSTLAQEQYGVLLADDSRDDRFFLRRTLTKNPKLVVVGEACDGDQAISYLTGNEEFGDRVKHPFPSVLLLDLKMPRRSGFDVLLWLQTQSFTNLAVFVISGSSLPQDADRSLALGARAYFQKAELLLKPATLFQEIENFFANAGKGAGDQVSPARSESSLLKNPA